MSTKAASFVERVEKANQQRFADRPTYDIGDVLRPMAPVEDAWRFDTGLRVTVYGDSTKPAEKILPPDYPIRDPRRAWVLVFVVPNTNAMPEAARRFMGRRGVVGYWPRAVVAVTRGRGPKRHLEQKCRSLFHGYVLAHVGRGIDLKATLEDHEAHRYGIAGPVRFGAQTAYVDDAIVADLVKREQEREFDSTDIVDGVVVEKGQSWQAIGSMIRIMSGPFQDFCAPIVRVDRTRNIVTVTVTIFGRASPVDMPLADVKAIV